MKKALSFVLIVALMIVHMPISIFAEELLNDGRGNTVIITNGNDVTIGSAYGEDEKLWLRFAPCGPNNLVQLYTIGKSDAASENPENIWLSSGTDWVGPVEMKAREADQSTTIYSGGWHKREDNSPSAKSESVVVKIDGEVQNGTITASGDLIEIIVTNELYTGVDLATSQSGMREIVHYKISNNTVDVETKLTALSDVTITQYFGLQGVTRTYNADMIQFINGQPNSAIGGYYTHASGTKTDYPDVNAVIHSNESGECMTMTLDRDYGLGNLEYLKSENHIATHSYMNKSYFNLVNGILCDVDEGQQLCWRGQYKFEKLPASETVIADYNALVRESLVSEPFSDATVTEDLTLPITGINGSKIMWESDDIETITETGVVKTPDITKTVTLKATIYDGNGASMVKHFSFRVPGKEGPVDSTEANVMPDKDSLIRSDSFDDNVIDTQTVVNITGNVKEEDGGLHFVRASSDGDVSANVYLKSDKTPVYGSSILEFNVSKKSTYTGITAYIYGGNGLICKIAMLANKQLTIYYGNGKGDGSEAKKELTSKEVESDTLNFKIAFDSGKGSFKVWINDSFICNEKNIYATTGVSYINFIQGKNSGLTTDVMLNDLSVYSAKTNGITKYKDDFDDGVMSNNITVLDAGKETVKEANGVLNVATSTATASSVSLRLNEDGSAASGKFSLEFQVNRTACNDAFDFYLEGSNGKNYLYGRLWQSNFHGYWADVADGDRVTHSTASSNTKMGIYLEINTYTKQFELWLNGVYQGCGYSLGGLDVINIKFAPFSTECDPAVDYFKYTDMTGEYENAVVQYIDSFDGSSVSNRIVLNNMEQSDGSLNVVDRTKTSVAKFYFNEDKSPVTGDFTLEFNTSRQLDYATTDFHFFGENDDRYTTIRWWSIGNANYASVECREDKSSSKTAKYKLNSEVGSGSQMHIKITFNTDNQTFSMWINGNEIVKNVLSSYDVDSVIYMSVENVFEANGSYIGTGYGNASLQDILYYKQAAKSGIAQISADYNPYDKKISIASPSDMDACVFAASYYEEKLVSCAFDSVELKMNDDIIADTSALKTSGANRVVIYIWKEGLAPVCESKTIDGMIDAN